MGTEQETKYTEEELQEHTVAELKEIAQSEDVNINSHATKDEIVSAIMEHQSQEATEPEGAEGFAPMGIMGIEPAAEPIINPLLTGPINPLPLADIVADLYGIGREYLIRLSDIVGLGANLQGNLLLDYAPPGAIMELVRIKHSQSVAGPGITACTAQLSDGVPNTYGSPFDVFQAVSPTALATVQPTSGNVMAFNAPTAIYLTLIATGANLGLATAGAISVWARYKLAADANPPHGWDATIQTPRVVPPY